jgi:hypothetical protein
MYSTRHPRRDSRDRAASSIVGLVLLFGLVFAGASVIFWAGMDAKQSVQTASEIDTAETSLQEVSSELATLSLKGEGATTSFDLSGKDPSDVSVVEDGKISFRLNGKTACTAEMEMGSIVYEHDSGATVAYQAGGVFKKQSGGTSIVQSPTLEYYTQNVDGEEVQSIRFPVTNVTGDVKNSGEVTASTSSNTGSTMREELCLTGANADKVDVVRQVNVTISDSSFADAWEEYFVDEFGASNVTVDDGDVTATVPLGGGVSADQFPVNDAKIFGGVYMGSSAGELLIKTPNVKVNSYDSSDVTGSTPEYNDSGDIYTRGDVEVTAQSHINGSVFSEGTVTLGNSCQVNGASPPGKERCVTQDVHFNNTTGGGLNPSSTSEREEAIGGAWTNGTIVPGIETMDATIVDTVDTVSEHNHNDSSSAIADGQIQYTDGSATIDGGVYHLDDLTVPAGSTLTIDTSNGDVVLAVENGITVESAGTLTVEGNGQVRTFVNGTSGEQLTLDDSATVNVRKSGVRTYRSDAFFVVCKAGCEATIGENAQFTGTLYGPGTTASSGQVTLEKDSQVWGALVAGTVEFDKKSEFHFDTSLENAGIDSDGDGITDDEDDNNYADSDNDGVPDSVDECDVAADGVNGCLPVTKDESRNALVVNQSSAEITVVGSMVADEKTITREVGERSPLDVQFAIDDSGSMADSTDWTWSNPDQWYDINSNQWATVPAGQQWKVKEAYTGYTTVYDAGDSVYLQDNDELKYLKDTVDTNRNWDVKYDDGSTDTFTGGTTVDLDGIAYIESYAPGNDPDDQRVDATHTFVGSLNDSLDEVGVYLFDADTNREHDIRSKGGDFDDANDSVALVDSTGTTNIAGTIVDATDRFEQNTDDEKVIVLLTDGEHNVDNPGIAGSGKDEVRNAADYAHGENVTIYTIALGDDADADLLEEIANTDDDDTDGAMYEAEDYSEMTGIFEQIAGETTKQRTNVIEYKDTTVQVNVGGSDVTLSGNANDPTDDTRPSKVVDIADLQGADDDEVEEYVGTLLSAQATTRACGDTTEFDTVDHNGDEYGEVTCDTTDGVFDDVTNSSSSHEIFVDGESVPDASEFEAGWFKDQSFDQVIDDYEADTGKTLVDDSTGTFDLDENDAVIVVKTNSSDSDTDYVVLHFEAKDTDVEYDTSDDDDADGEVVADTEPDTTDDNDYVVDISQTTVEVGNESTSIRPAATNAPATVSELEYANTNPSTDAANARARTRLQ